MASTMQQRFEARREQMFWRLEPAEIDRLRHFGKVCRYVDGEALFEAGKPAPGMFIVLAGTVRVTRRDGLGHDLFVVDQITGDFVAEVGSLSGRQAFVDGHAAGAVEALLIAPDGLRALVISEADLGERIMRALILRRISLIEAGIGGPIIIARTDNPDLVRLQGFLTRNALPHRVLDPSDDAALGLLRAYAPGPSELPLVLCPDGSVLRNPDEAAVARTLGLLHPLDPDKVYDVAIVGAGPAGLATAVYAASEGLSVVVFDQSSFGGQAGASSRIENYLGFPAGISGQALAGLAFTQAQKFGAEIMIPLRIERLECRAGADGYGFALHHETGPPVRARTVVAATGAEYRRPRVPGLASAERNGVHYWASPVEASLCADQDVVMVGGGNSAGQAAVFLSSRVKNVFMVVRGEGLSETMSQYLIERISAQSNITLMTEIEIERLSTDETGALCRVQWRHRRSGVREERAIRHLFLFIGANPCGRWLKDCGAALDPKGFIRTGEDVGHNHNGARRARSRLETSVPGLFAIGDVRSGSTKRVAAAVGEGAAVVAQIHLFLADMGR